MGSKIYHIGNKRVVINDHSTNKTKEALKKLIDDNTRQDDKQDGKSATKSGKSKRSTTNNTKA